MHYHIIIQMYKKREEIKVIPEIDNRWNQRTNKIAAKLTQI